MTSIKEFIGEDYVHSANSLFHFMNEEKYLISALRRKALCPRYCSEDISYLKITNGGTDFSKVAVLQKCFCDIPLRNIVRKFEIHLTENNDLSDEQKRKLRLECSHTDLYGRYALSFSKKWGEEKKLQPVHYISQESAGTARFSQMFHDVLQLEDLPDSVSDMLLNWLCFLKPLRGTMWHRLETEDQERVDCEIFKNFHDEHEWRFVPADFDVDGTKFDSLIANGAVGSGFLRSMSDKIEEERFRSVWLPFQYEDIRYIVVPDGSGRRNVIEAIQKLPDGTFEDLFQQATLISKILVLDDIMKDF